MTRPSIRSAISLLVLACLAAVLPACGSDGNDTATNTTVAGGGAAAGGEGAPLKVKLGALVTLNGPAAFVGIAHQKSLKVAEKIINADPVKYLGGSSRSLEFDVREAGTDVPQATTLARTFASDPSYHAILGPSTSPQALSVGPFAQQAKIPLIIPFSPAPGLTDPGEYVFKLATSNDILAELLLPKVVPARSIKKAGVIYNTDNQANLLAGEAALKTFKAQGVETVDFTLPFASNDYAAGITKMKSSNVDAIFIATNSGGVVSAITQADREKFSPLWLGGPLAGDPTVVKGAGNLVKDKLIFASDYDSQLQTPLAKEFREKYLAEAGAEADQYAADGITSALVIAAAVKTVKGGSLSRDELAKILAGLTDIEVVIGDGKMKFDGKRQAVITPALYKIGPNTTVEPLN